MSQAHSHAGHGHAHQGEADHHAEHELPFWRKYIFSTDHKWIGIQYTVTALCFLFFGFSLMMIMRWQLAYPGQRIPILGSILGAPTVDPSLGILTGYGFSRASPKHYHSCLSSAVSQHRLGASFVTTVPRGSGRLVPSDARVLDAPRILLRQEACGNPESGIA